MADAVPRDSAYRAKLDELISAGGWPCLLDMLSTLADNEADALFRAGLEGSMVACRKLRSVARKLHKASLECEVTP